MKNVLKLFLLLAVFSVAFAGSNKFKLYEFKSAIVEYKLSGSSKGTKTKYIKEYGFKEATYEKSSAEAMGFSSEKNEVVILDGYDMISVDFDKKTGIKMKNEVAVAMAEENIDPAEFGKEMLKAMEYTKLSETGTVAGKKCEIWKGNTMGMDIKIWVWKNLTLKSESSGWGMKSKMEATSIKLDVSVPDSKFEAPKGIKFVDPNKVPSMENLMKFGE